MSNKLQALQYIVNTGGSISIEHFDDDNEPIGPLLRNDLLKAELITVDANDMICLSSKGRIALNTAREGGLK